MATVMGMGTGTSGFSSSPLQEMFIPETAGRIPGNRLLVLRKTSYSPVSQKPVTITSPSTESTGLTIKEVIARLVVSSPVTEENNADIVEGGNGASSSATEPTAIEPTEKKVLNILDAFLGNCLIWILKSSNPKIRDVVARILGRLGHQKSIEFLVRDLKRDDNLYFETEGIVEDLIKIGVSLRNTTINTTIIEEKILPAIFTALKDISVSYEMIEPLLDKIDLDNLDIPREELRNLLNPYISARLGCPRALAIIYRELQTLKLDLLTTPLKVREKYTKFYFGKQDDLREVVRIEGVLRPYGWPGGHDVYERYRDVETGEIIDTSSNRYWKLYFSQGKDIISEKKEREIDNPRYSSLLDRIRELEKIVERGLERMPIPRIIPLSEYIYVVALENKLWSLGQKAVRLIEIFQSSFSVPYGFVVPSEATEEEITESLDSIISQIEEQTGRKLEAIEAIYV
jgi:hypothetical protein